MTDVDVQNASPVRNLPDETDIRRWVEAALRGAGVPTGRRVSVKIVDRAEMQGLNRRYRGRDRPTNVLSFAAEPVPGLPPDAQRLLGDIAVCADVVLAEAEAQGKAARDHWAHMLVHGALHLAGLDHVSDEGAREMEALEARILGAQGIADPYRVE